MIIDRFTVRDKLAEIAQQRSDLHVTERLRKLRDEERQLQTADSTLDSWAHALTTSANEVGALAPKVDALTVWRDHLVVWKATLTTRLNAKPTYVHDPKEQAKFDTLAMCVRKIEVDDAFLNGGSLETSPLRPLMEESGYHMSIPDPVTNRTFGSLPWFGSLDVVERDLRMLQVKLADAESRLADALVDPATLAARHQAAAEAANAGPMTKITADNRVIHVFRDGRVEDVGPGPGPINVRQDLQPSSVVG